MFYRRHLCGGEKRGRRVGPTMRGKGTKLMAVADAHGLRIAVHAGSASPHKVTLVQDTVAQGFTVASPERLIGDKAYDRDPLDIALAEIGIQLIAPHKVNRIALPTRDRRALRRYRRRWKVERLFAWLQNLRRILIRVDYHPENYLGFVRLGCILILLGRYL